MLLLKRKLESAGQVLGILDTPSIFTPFSVTISEFGFVSEVFPPCSDAISKMIEPLFMESISSELINFGAFFPGISAVVIMISEFEMLFEISFFCLSL